MNTVGSSIEPLEKAILGSVLMNSSIALELDVEPYMFETWRNVADVVWGEISSKGSTNGGTIAYECEKRSICSKDDIWSLVANVSGDTKEHCTNLRKEWLRRQEIDLHNSSLSRLYAGDDPDDIIAEAEAQREIIGGFSEDHNETRVSRTMGFMDEVYAAKSGKKKTGWSTGLTILDSFMGGIRLNRFAMIGARPGMGKTTMTLQMCIALAEQGVGVAFFCYEMPFNLIMQAIVQMRTGIPRDRMDAGQITDDEAKQIQLACEWFYDLPLYIEDYPYNYSRLMMKMRQYNKKYNVGVIFIDYIQRIKNDIYKGSRKDLEVGEMSTGMANLTLSEPLTIIALSQLSRECEKRADKRPVESDVRESGSLEADARQMGFIYRDKKYYPHSEDPRTEFILRKNSYSGKTGTIYLMYDPIYNLYREANCQKWEYDGEDFEEPKDNYTPNIAPPPRKDDGKDIPF